MGNNEFIDVLNSDAKYAVLTVGTTPVEVKVGASPLADRQSITIQPNHSGLCWGYDSSVTTTTGTRMSKGKVYIFPIGQDISVYLVAGAASRSARIGELS